MGAFTMKKRKQRFPNSFGRLRYFCFNPIQQKYMSVSKTLSGYFLNDNSNSNIVEIAPFSVESTLLFHGPLNY